jgi:hypothetical protein
MENSSLRNLIFFSWGKKQLNSLLVEEKDNLIPFSLKKKTFFFSPRHLA